MLGCDLGFKVLPCDYANGLQRLWVFRGIYAKRNPSQRIRWQWSNHSAVPQKHHWKKLPKMNVKIFVLLPANKYLKTGITSYNLYCIDKQWACRIFQLMHTMLHNICIYAHCNHTAARIHNCTRRHCALLLQRWQMVFTARIKKLTINAISSWTIV